MMYLCYWNDPVTDLSRIGCHVLGKWCTHDGGTVVHVRGTTRQLARACQLKSYGAPLRPKLIPELDEICVPVEIAGVPQIVLERS